MWTARTVTTSPKKTLGTAPAPNTAWAVTATVLLALTLSLPLSQTRAADWPNWRGPTFDGISTESQWDATNLKQNWKIDVGTGYASVSVKENIVYTAGWRGGQDRVIAIDAKTGKPLWSHGYKIDKFDVQHRGGSGGTPGLVTIGSGSTAQTIVAYMHRDGSVVGIDAKTGKRKWFLALARKARIDAPRWKFAGSVVPAPASDPSPGAFYVDIGRIIKINAKTGKVIWSSDNYKPAYSTPVPFERDGKQFVAAFPEFGLVILNAKTGKRVTGERWETPYGVNAATPLVANDGNQVFIATGYGIGAALYNFDGKNIRPAWETKQMRNKLSSSLRIGDRLYGFDESQLNCLDWNTGKRIWNKRGLGLGSLTAAGNKLIIMTGSGELVIAQADPANFVELHRVKLFSGNDNWVVPVIANGNIYARSPGGTLISLATQ